MDVQVVEGLTFIASRWEEWGIWLKGLTQEDIRQLLDRYSALGPLPGIMLPLLESLFPFLPLIVFVFANAIAYGMWAGFFYSWLGVCCGALIVFLFSRWLGRKFGDRIRRRYPKTERFFAWVEHRGFTPIFLLSCFPFTPSAFVNISAGFSRMPLYSFLTAIILGKAVMIFILSYLGADLEKIIEQPWRVAVVLIVLVVLWLGGKKLESKFKMKA